MKPLSIGQLVRVRKFAEVGYYDGLEKKLATFDVEPFLALIVGQTVKRLGTYHSGSRGDGWSGDYEEASLSISGSVTLWLVRAGMVNKPLCIRDEDIEPVPSESSEFKLPWRAAKPRRIKTATEPA